jgi:ubiquinone/menaquinone biosynthesis C-methylase UbiE
MEGDEFARQDIEFHRATAASYDDDITATYGVYHRYMLDPFLDHVAEQTGPARALDLGCGTGVISLSLAERGFDVLGIDHSEDMLAVAKQKLASTQVSGNCNFVVGDVRHLPAEDHAFECVTCQGLLHHLPEMQSCLTELNRVLRPGGYFYISEPTRDPTPLRRTLRFLAHVKRLGRVPPAPDEPDSVEEPIDPDELRAILDGLGLPYRMEFLTHLPPLRRALPERLYVPIMRAASAPWRRKQGDLVFVFGRKPELESSP